MPLPYDPPRAYTPASGGIPVAVNPADAANAALDASLGNLDKAKKLGQQTNEFMVGQYTGRVPGYTDMAQQSSANIASALLGEVPQDVLTQLAQGAAERGIMRGIPGSQASNADYLRGLGLTSLGLQKYGEEALTGATNRLNAVPSSTWESSTSPRPNSTKPRPTPMSWEQPRSPMPFTSEARQI